MKKIIIVSILSAVSIFIVACGGSNTDNPAATGKVIKSAPIGDKMTVTLSSDTGRLKNGEQEVTLAFTDASGKAVDVGAASLNFNMPAMGSMAAMNDAATLKTTATPGIYLGNVKIEMAGEWQAQLAYEGPAGKGKTSFSVTAQ